MAVIMDFAGIASFQAVTLYPRDHKAGIVFKPIFTIMSLSSPSRSYKEFPPCKTSHKNKKYPHQTLPEESVLHS